jgi:hypothetical protein
MTKAILSVVRHKLNPTFTPFEQHLYSTAWYVEHYTEAERRDSYAADCTELLSRAGKYIKSGGGNPTDDLQQAQIFGWSRSAKKSLEQYPANLYDIVPILIQVA